MVGFCILGIGNCKKTTEQKAVETEQLKKIKELISKNIQEFSINSKTTIQNFNELMLKAAGDIIISDIEIKQYAEITSKTILNVKEILKSDDFIDDMINIASEISLKSMGDKGIFGAGKKTITSTEQNLLTEIKEKFKLVVKTKDEFGCIDNVLNKNKLTAKAGGDIVVHGYHIEQTSKIMSTCVITVIKNIFKKLKINEKIINDLKSEEIEKTGINWTYVIISIVILIIIIFIYILSKKNIFKYIF
jgi:hypothetical protein